jgi:hypothetical protein
MTEQNTTTTTHNIVELATQKPKNKKIKKVKAAKLFEDIEFVIEEEQGTFVIQQRRKDVLANMLLNIALGGSIMFTLLMSDNHSDPSASRQGFLFETICEILIILKCIPKIHYTHILSGKVDVSASLKQVTNINSILSNQIHQGNNVSDITIELEGTIIGFSCKYNKQEKISVKSTDISSLEATLKSNWDNYKVGLFVKDKQAISKSIKPDIHNNAFEKVTADNLLFDEKNIINALDVFCYRYKDVKISVDEFIEQKINAELLVSPRRQLVEKLHQRMTKLKFERSIAKNTRKMWAFAQKPRSGKSITIQLICKYLLEKAGGYNKILVMTSVPATINSFIKDLEEYIDFKDIGYVNLDKNKLSTATELDRGIVFCSVQYLKSDLKGTKKEFLKNMGFDAIVIDESHQGSSTVKTQKGILEVECDQDIENLCQTIKLNIFASGTATKTKQYYQISDAFTYEWEIEDEGNMKELLKPDLSPEERDAIIQNMVKKHGPIFLECLQDNTLDQDYSKHPAQVLMKYSIPQSLMDDIVKYNIEHNTKFGFSFTSLFALKQSTNSNGEIGYVEEFDICKYGQDGIDILTGLLELVISKNQMKPDTIMKEVEATQASFDSRQSTVAHPLMFIMYLPTHTRNNTIALLQKTLKAFLEKHKLWCDYNVEYSNSSEDSSDVKEDYNDSIETKMKKTRELKKRGCILLLGDKGSVGITYNECDVTISLDDGHNLDNYKQRVSRSLTPSVPGAPKKTLGIAVDLNIQRTYLYLNDMIHRHRRNTKTVKTNAEILQYYFEHKIFLFNPQQINNGKFTRVQITSFYEEEADKIMKEIDDTLILEQIVCDDALRFVIKMDVQKSLTIKKANPELEGLQQDCPKGESEKIQIDAPKNLDTRDLEGEELGELSTKEDDEKIEQLINRTYEMCKTFLFPLLALISRSYKIFDFKEIFAHPSTKELIVSLLKDKKIELNKDNFSSIINIMNQIMDNNAEIVNNIREIYLRASYEKLQYLIAKHFIPTSDEKKLNAEVPTPVLIVKEMVATVPATFWTQPRAVFEPCCGKGNFVLEIVRKFNDGLLELYPDNEIRIKIIMTQCIYYADITALNVFITTQLLRCEYESICGQSSDDIDFEFNSYTGDTLLIDVAATFGQDKFDAVIGNPPYSTDPSKPDTKPLYDKFIEKYVDICGILLFVVPSRWFVGGKGLDKFRDFMMRRTDIALIKHEDDATKWFGKDVEIKGGVNYFLKDAEHEGLCLFNGMEYALSKYDCVIKPTYHAIIDTVISMESVNKLYMGRFFGVETNDKRFKDSGKIKCFVSTLKSKDRCKYLENFEFNDKNTFWKVITPEAAFGAFSGFGAKFIGHPNEVHTGSYISFRVANEQEANSLLSYLETKFANHLLSVRKISQHINGDVCKWIPLVPLDRIWTDEAVCEHLHIDQSMYI